MATITIYSPNGTPAASITTDNIEDVTNILTTIYETISKETLIYEEAKKRAEPIFANGPTPTSLDEWIADHPAEWARMKGIEELSDRDAYCPTCQRYGLTLPHSEQVDPGVP